MDEGEPECWREFARGPWGPVMSLGSGDEFGVKESTDREGERSVVSPLLRRTLPVSL